MTPGPTLPELIATVRQDSPEADPLAQLAQASQIVADLEDVGDALLGHFVDQCRRSGRSWSEISRALGVTKQAAHKRFSVQAPTFERFTDRARTVLKDAAEIARSFGHSSVETAHLLLALYGSAKGLAAQVLTEAGITREACEARILPQVAEKAASPLGQLPFSSAAIEVLRGSVEEALRLGHNYIGTEHLLLALLRDPFDIAATTLVSLGMTYDDANARLADKFAEIARSRSGPGSPGPIR